MSKFEIYTDKKGETRFRYRAKNGEIVFSSEGYTAKASAKRAIASIRKNVADATVEEIAASSKNPVTSKIATKGAAAKAKAAKPAAKPKAAAKPAG